MMVSLYIILYQIIPSRDEKQHTEATGHPLRYAAQGTNVCENQA